MDIYQYVMPLRRTLHLAGATCAVAFGLSACGSHTLDFRNAEIVNGKVYSQGSDDSFSGKLTNAPLTSIVGAQRGFVQVSNTINAAAPYIDARNVSLTYIGIPLGLVCDVQIDDGLLDGKSVCMTPQSDTVRLEMTFSKGALDGALRFYGEDGKKTVSDAAFTSGSPDGTQKVYSPFSGNLVLEVPWTHGAMTGTENGYNDASGKKILEAHRNDAGRLDGAFMEWSADGTLIHKLTYVDGKKEGTEELYYPETGKTRSHSEWKDGKQDGLTATYNAAGDLESSQHFAAGERVYTPEEAHTIADQQARDAYDHCIKSAEMNGVGAGRPSTEGVTQQQEAQCGQIAQQVSSAALNDPGANGRVVSIPATGDGVMQAVAADKPAPTTSTSPDLTNSAAGDSNACVNSWVADYQKGRDANGLSDAVSDDQFNEWQEWCRQGKRPG